MPYGAHLISGDCKTYSSYDELAADERVQVSKWLKEIRLSFEEFQRVNVKTFVGGIINFFSGGVCGDRTRPTSSWGGRSAALWEGVSGGESDDG